MKNLILGLVAAAALGTAVPAAAHEGDYYGQRPNNDWGYSPGLGQFSDDVAHLREGIQHGLADGSYSRWEARRFSWEVSRLERQIRYYNAEGGFNPWERSMIQRQLDRIHDIMHQAHDQGHERRDGGYDGYNRYNRDGGYNDYDGYRR